VSALAVSAAIVKVPSKTLEATALVTAVSKPWYRKTSFREAARSIRSVSTGLSSGSSPSNSFKSKPAAPKHPLHHHRVSSLKLAVDDAKPSASMVNTNSQSVPVIQSKVNAIRPIVQTESFSSTVTSPSTDSSLASPSSLERITAELIRGGKKIEVPLAKPESEVQVIKQHEVGSVNRDRAVFDIGSDDDDDDENDRNDFDNVVVKIDVKKANVGVDTHHVTLINTLLNANIHQTSEGNAIRKQLAADPQSIDGLISQTSVTVAVVAAESRLFHEQRPILTIEPPSPMPSFSLPNHPLCFDESSFMAACSKSPLTNIDLEKKSSQASETHTYDSNSRSGSFKSSRRNVPLNDSSNIVTFARKQTATQKSIVTNSNINNNTCNSSCNIVSTITNKNKLTVPLFFDLVSLNLGKLTGERKSCQRSHSTSVHDRGRTEAECTVRCASLSPANSFRGMITKRQHPIPINTFSTVSANANNNKTVSSLSSPSLPSSSSGFHRSLEGDLGYPGCPQKYDELPRTGTSTAQELDPNRPSPDQDMGCSPRGTNAFGIRDFFWFECTKTCFSDS